VLEQEARVPLAAAPNGDPILSKIFDQALAAGGRVPVLYRALGAAPRMLEAWVGFAWRLRANCETSRALRELVILRVAESRHSLYELQQHRRMATEAGVSQERQDAVCHWREASIFTPAERSALAVADELIDFRDVSGEAFEALRDSVGDAGAIEVVLTASFYECVATFLTAVAIPLERET
jgi:alkylhydroperoxidase family enzyme